MSQSPNHGISRQGLDQAFAADEARKSELLLAAQLLRAQGQPESAAAKFAEAAVLEERLSERCAALGLGEKAGIHRYSAASCWAQAGNFYQALTLCDDLLAQPDLPERLRGRIQDFGQHIRARRTQWYADLELATAGADD
jgi:hypothetical protein